MPFGNNLPPTDGTWTSTTPGVVGPLSPTRSTRQDAPVLDNIEVPWARLRLGPLGGSAAIAGLFFLIWYLVLRPGYWINDDLKAIWALVGYPSGSGPNPFFIHSNVLLGFALDALYVVPTRLNWAMILYALINAFSVWMLLYLLLEAKVAAAFKTLGGAILLGGIGAPAINLTYTFTAGLSSVAGLCLLLSASRRGATHWRGKAAAGVVFVLIGSLIRLEMVGLLLAITLPTVMFLAGSMNRRRLTGATVAAVALIGAGYGFNRLYVRLHPAWNYYYAYDSIREQLHDAHRLGNLHNQIHRVGWTPNDQELFAHWFFPDGGTYSFEHIRYLVEHTSSASQNPSGTASEFFKSLTTEQSIPYLAFAVGMGLWAAATLFDTRRVVFVLAPPAAALALNLYLTWAYKDPDYVLVGTLGTSLALSVLTYAWFRTTAADAAGLGRGTPTLASMSRICAILLVAIGATMLVRRAVASSNLNRSRSTAYQMILGDLDRLRATAAIPADALIVSPAHGLPYEWSYPFVLTRPAVSYFDMGWITFSPVYLHVLQAYDIASLPQALLDDSRLYLMVDEGFTPILQKYYSEHDSTAVEFVPLYAMPNALGLPGYDGIYLFRVRLSP